MDALSRLAAQLETTSTYCSYRMSFHAMRVWRSHCTMSEEVGIESLDVHWTSMLFKETQILQAMPWIR
jgi:hypothetical protein